MAAGSLRAGHVHAGDAAPERTCVLSRTDLVKYAGASGDFNPMHHDDTQAQAAGLPSVFGHGMFTAGLLATALTDYVGLRRLVRYQVRFTKQTWPGELLRTRITVAGTRAEGDRELVDLECSVANDAGEVKLTGRAVAVADPA